MTDFHDETSLLQLHEDDPVARAKAQAVLDRHSVSLADFELLCEMVLGPDDARDKEIAARRTTGDWVSEAETDSLDHDSD